MLIDQITQMKSRGLPTGQIIQSLRQQGLSPKEINEALSQSEIKSEIKSQNIFPGNPSLNMQQPNMNSNSENSSFEQNSISEMEPSIGQQLEYNQETESMEEYQPPVEKMQDYSQYQQYPQNESYPEYQQSSSSDIETINDICSQIIDEKIKNFKKEFEQFSTFKKESHNKLEELDKRLIRIEDTIEELKISIIRKVGEYGADIKNISEELRETQNSFSKIINPLREKAVSMKNSEENKNPKKQKEESDSFENYLR